MNTPMTVSEKALARYEYQRDPSVSVQQLADEFGVSRSAMLRALHGVTRRPGGIERSRLSTEQMIRMRDAGLSLREIGRQAGLTESGVWRRLNPTQRKLREMRREEWQAV
jgi:CTP-dependent riboflavin kinase